jgi:hypothetical protein
MPWFVIAARLEAQSASDAVGKLRRSSTVLENVEQINNDAAIVFERLIAVASPWKPAETAPKDRAFIGYDRGVGYAETAQWDAHKKKFLNFTKDAEAKFTEWMECPTG